MLGKIEATAAFIRQRTGFDGKIALVLGSGLGGLVQRMEVETTLDYAEIPDFPLATVEGHSGKLIFGILGGKKVLVMQGRFHYYEGYSMEELTFPVRVFRMLGVEYYLLSNAAGGINHAFEVGDLMMISDHINYFGVNPLIGKNIDELGPRFPDMTHAYSPELQEIARTIARNRRMVLHEGVYVGLTGPSFETPAEYRFFHTIGGDAVGMSTVPEVIVANHMKMKVFGISVVTNNGLAISEGGNKHTDVLDVASLSAPKLEQIFTELIQNIPV
ncbi:MAG TPA: purine-nucleoside phosphorylase [Prolixibacteraceae bacterium]|nr:purine-nucleoside phosphorylase [Prolixibacteraceae bacterium]